MRLKRAAWGDQCHRWNDAVVAWAAGAPATLRPATVRRYLTSLAAVAGIEAQVQAAAREAAGQPITSLGSTRPLRLQQP